MSKCKHCLEEFDTTDKPSGWMANHSRWCDKNPKLESYKKVSRKKSVEAMNKAKQLSGFTNQYSKPKVLGEDIPQSKSKGRKFKGTPHTSESKNKISTARKKYLLENPDKHPWKRSDKFVSVPCENFKKFLTANGIHFVSEYSPLDDRSFSIDIAFPDLKIGIEINGNQHYDREGNLLSYYQERHDTIEGAGWVLHEFHYANFFDDVKMRKILVGLPGLEPGIQD